MVNILKGNRGSALTIALATMAVCGILGYAIMDFMANSKGLNAKTDSLVLMQITEDSLIWTIENDDAWKATVAGNPSQMGCLGSTSAICPVGVFPLALLLADGTLETNGDINDTSGFDYYGTACTGFNPAAPNDNCPFKFTITWSPACGGGPCPPTVLSIANGVAIQPPVNIQINLVYSGTNSTYSLINLKDRFNKTFVRGSINGSLAASCRAANGNFDPASQNCYLQKSSCPAGQVLNGFDGVGNPICIANNFSSSSCGSGFAPVKVKTGGGFDCWKF